ncbi:MAG TPA: glycogen/starch/alpha-glucan phosphorylase [Candidatus Cloacimonadota bacterium]|nr:glycogen/starch/alpha-glucan phosphorylase [Candidatus Cloacimonadota bacterium]HPT71613.1 glycogen/starch/alpha-glucan phosphorylase [Candidatus Cloacimonadota bacterium]
MKEGFLLRNEPSIFFTDSIEEHDNILHRAILKHLEYTLGKDRTTTRYWDVYQALALTLRDRLIEKWLRTQYEYRKRDVKKLYYLSMEFLVGRLLGNTLINLDVFDFCRGVLKEIGFNLEDIADLEPDMGLGNGGLGRLAACFMDSLATQEYPAYGYGIRYEFGIFKQGIQQGYQIEEPDNWLKEGNPWEICRPEITYRVRFGGKVEKEELPDGRIVFHWVDTHDVMAVAWDTPIPGYKTNTVNNLRLWQAKATDEFDFDYFNNGDYVKAVERKNISENISKVLYPNDNLHLGKILRLQQEYFFVSATLQDIFHSYKRDHDSFKEFPDKIAIQLNDTHPAIAIPEMMRMLMDEERLSWEDAWNLTRKTFGYTNHTVMPEALEKWSVSLFEQMLPRHLQIIYDINNRLLSEVTRRYPGNLIKIKNMSVIEEGKEKFVRMAQLSVLGSHSVNGVAEIHTDIIKSRIFPDYYEMCPEKFNNKTNGITQRLWLKECNPRLAKLITKTIGDRWVIDLSDMKKLEQWADDPTFRANFTEEKWRNKQALARYIYKENGVHVNPASMFDVHVKRLHEYKRQLLNVLHIITLYNRIKADPNIDIVPRTVILAGKAAPGYFIAKLIIKLVNSVAEVVNSDPDVGDKLKVVFLKNYCVSLAEKIIPAADLSEQISTAGYEASGTGNMKFALNGALTIGTLDGANVEMLEEIGEENIFIFGLKAQEVVELKKNGYNPMDYYHANMELKKALDMIQYNYFSVKEPGIFKPIVESLLKHGDQFLLLADYASYIEMQEKVSEEYRDTTNWMRKAILNVARIGKFSSDRAIKQYADEIWGIKPREIKM